MSNEKPTYQELEKTVQKLKDEREKRIKAEERLKKLEKKYTFEDITVPMQVEQALLEEKNRVMDADEFIAWWLERERMKRSFWTVVAGGMRKNLLKSIPITGRAYPRTS